MVQQKNNPSTLPVHERMPYWVLLLGIFVGGGLLMFFLGWLFSGLPGKNQFAYAIRSPLAADYSGDRPAAFAPVNLDTMMQLVFGDTERGQQNQQAVANQMKTPVPSVTPLPNLSEGSVTQPPAVSTATAVDEPPTATATSSPAAGSPTPTLSGTPTSMPTMTQAPTRTLPASTANPTAVPTNPPPQPTMPPVPTATVPEPTAPPPPTSPPPQPTDPPAPTAYPPPPGPTSYPAP